MASTYLFFEPEFLPLTPDNLDPGAVQPVVGNAVRAALDSVLPGIRWLSPEEGRAESEGRWLEFQLGGGTLSLRCSLRADHADIVQSLCDRLGWIAFDERPYCYQPGREPFPM